MNLSVTSTVKSRHLMIPKRITRKANQARIMKVPAEQRLQYFCQFVGDNYIFTTNLMGQNAHEPRTRYFLKACLETAR